MELRNTPFVPDAMPGEGGINRQSPLTFLAVSFRVIPYLHQTIDMNVMLDICLGLWTFVLNWKVQGHTSTAVNFVHKYYVWLPLIRSIILSRTSACILKNI